MFHPKEYSRNIGPFLNLASNLFQKHGKLLKWNSEPESIMDLGIGDGKMTKEYILPNIIPKNVKEYIGADISMPMLESAKQSIQHDKFKTIQLDITTKTLPTELRNRFHHIITNYLFHHISDIRQALINIQHMLRPGGQLMFNTLDELVMEDAYEILDQGKWSKYNHRQAHSGFYGVENALKEYKDLIESLGYVDCHLFMEKIKRRLPKESFEELILYVSRPFQDVKEEDKEEYIKDYIEAVREGKMVELITNESTGVKEYELTLNIITGIVSKTL